MSAGGREFCWLGHAADAYGLVQIGFGNWGSVWLCKPRHNPRAPGADELSRLQSSRMAVKLVHRKKDENEKRTAETAARVKSLCVVNSMLSLTFN